MKHKKDNHTPKYSLLHTDPNTPPKYPPPSQFASQDFIHIADYLSKPAVRLYLLYYKHNTDCLSLKYLVCALNYDYRTVYRAKMSLNNYINSLYTALDKINNAVPRSCDSNEYIHRQRENFLPLLASEDMFTKPELKEITPIVLDNFFLTKEQILRYLSFFPYRKYYTYLDYKNFPMFELNHKEKYVITRQPVLKSSCQIGNFKESTIQKIDEKQAQLKRDILDSVQISKEAKQQARSTQSEQFQSKQSQSTQSTQSESIQQKVDDTTNESNDI